MEEELAVLRRMRHHLQGIVIRILAENNDSKKYLEELEIILKTTEQMIENKIDEINLEQFFDKIKDKEVPLQAIENERLAREDGTHTLVNGVALKIEK